jgi:hypothetical protein
MATTIKKHKKEAGRPIWSVQRNCAFGCSLRAVYLPRCRGAESSEDESSSQTVLSIHLIFMYVPTGELLQIKVGYIVVKKIKEIYDN